MEVKLRKDTKKEGVLKSIKYRSSVKKHEDYCINSLALVICRLLMSSTSVVLVEW